MTIPAAAPRETRPNPVFSRRAALLALAATAAVLAGCSMFGAKPLFDAPKAAPAPALIERPGKAVVRVDDTDSGARIVLERSQELIVRLPFAAARRGEWSLVDLVPGVVGVVSGPTFERGPRNEAADESEGSAVWHLKALAAGNVTLGFQLRAPRSLDPATRTASYAVTVK
ncbi:MAG TPA: hypothetical protein VNU71_09305 [Burkholderiaceae bacterium]|nr:hypothetical protein [Burkholderiaceae bacterium]